MVPVSQLRQDCPPTLCILVERHPTNIPILKVKNGDKCISQLLPALLRQALFTCTGKFAYSYKLT